MKQYYKIVIDTKGADKGAETIIKGAAEALKVHAQLAVVLVGDKDLIEQVCNEQEMPKERVEIIDAPDAITNYDSPAMAVMAKPQASLTRALAALAEREELFGMITAGNTGAVITGAMRYLSGKERVRPALSAVLPAANGGFVCLVDTGATVDCTASILHHFATLGSRFMKSMYGIENPRIGLLSNGAEATKGNKLVKETHQILAEDPALNFVGNIEGSNALSGDCDVLVCDGFAGNQVLKVTEGTATRIITDIVKYAKRTDSTEIMQLVGHLMGIYDIGSLGGGILLGIEKPVIKAHGAAGAGAIVSTAGMLLNMAQNKAVFDQSKNKI